MIVLTGGFRVRSGERPTVKLKKKEGKFHCIHLILVSSVAADWWTCEALLREATLAVNIIIPLVGLRSIFHTELPGWYISGCDFYFKWNKLLSAKKLCRTLLTDITTIIMETFSRMRWKNYDNSFIIILYWISTGLGWL